MVSTFLRTFYTEEELSKMSYNGTKENLGLPVQFKECLNAAHDNSCTQCSTVLETESVIAEAIDNMESSEQKEDTEYDFIMATEHFCLVEA
ncbi:hypothetical protein JTE90_006753 [Oedothorax gibbosus]|uniref:Uncharacterized protein n=1 Tax=Oedothorax gibbosus TaxID=931172 RepID=A0AAV6UIV0_9ARAC|nr:hypothetical protein JTE90_006753 [Oedothorax gibbosus]